MCHADRLDRFCGFGALEVVTDYMRGAAELARQSIIDMEHETPFARVLTLTTILRLVWSQNYQLAENMMARDATVKDSSR